MDQKIVLLFAAGLAVSFLCLSSHAGAADPGRNAMLLFDFEDAADSRWFIVNDGVMGGRSQGYGRVTGGILRFEGTLVTRGGGFTSLRTSKRIDLSGYDGLELRVRGASRRFEVEVNDDNRYGWRPISRRAAFEAREDWRSVRVPFSGLRPTVFGRPVSVPEIDLASVQRIGFYIIDGIDGPFWLEVDRIDAYRDD